MAHRENLNVGQERPRTPRGTQGSKLVSGTRTDSRGRGCIKDQLLELRREVHSQERKFQPRERVASTQRGCATARRDTPRQQRPRSARPQVVTSGTKSCELSPSSASSWTPSDAAPNHAKGDRVTNVRRLLRERHGSTAAAFDAVDSDKDGWVGAADVFEELQRSGISPQPLVLTQLMQELDEKWKGCAGFPDFLATFGSPDECLACKRCDFLCGEMVEVAYHLKVTTPSAASIFVKQNSRKELPMSLEPFLVLVPAGFNSKSTAANVSVSVVHEKIQCGRLSGIVQFQMPNCAPGVYEFRLFTGNCNSGMGSQLGTSLVCAVDTFYPPVPINFRATAGPSHAEEILTAWAVPVETPSSLMSYEVQYERLDDDGAVVKVLRLYTPDLNLTIENVINDVQYRLRVRSIGFSDVSKWTEAVEVRCGVVVPNPPECVRARCVTAHGSDATGSKLQISWSNSKGGDFGSPLLGFRVYWQTLHSSGGSLRAGGSPRAKSESSSQFVDKSARDCIVGGLSSSTFYACYVVSVNSAGESEASTKVKVWTTETRAGAPALPVVLGQPAKTVAFLQWQPPSDSGGHPVANYEIVAIVHRCSPSSSPLRTAARVQERAQVCQCPACKEGEFHVTEDMLLLSTHSPTCEYQVDGLDADSLYSFRVRAVTQVGTGTWSQESEKIRTESFPPRSPGRPLASALGPNSCHLCWTASAYDGGSPILGYIVHVIPTVPDPSEVYSYEVSCNASHAADVSGGSPSTSNVVFEVVDNLKTDCVYSFQVQARSEIGTSDMSECSELVRTKCEPPPPPENLRVKENGERQVLLVWDPPEIEGANAFRYQVVITHSDNFGENPQEIFLETPDGTPQMTVNVQSFSRYVFRVTTLCNNSASKSSVSCEISIPKATPECPQALTVVEMTRTSASLAWQAPADDGGEKIERYEVLVFDVSEGLTLVKVQDTNQPFPGCDIEGLMSHTAYAFQVRGISAYGVGECCELSSPAQTLAHVPDPPPEAPEPKEVGVATRVNLSWLAPEQDGGLPILHFIIMVRCVAKPKERKSSDCVDLSDDADVVDDTQDEWEVATCNTRATHIVTGLVPGASYEFRVCSVSAAGKSEPSQTSEVFHTGPRPPSAPGRPWLYGPSCTPPFQPMIGFSAPDDGGDAPIDCYRCIAFVQGHVEDRIPVDLKIVGADGNILTSIAQGLHGNKKYQFAVQACNAGGWGPLGPSSPLEFVWCPFPPTRLTPIISESNRVSLSWDAAINQHGEPIRTYSLYITQHETDHQERTESEHLVYGADSVNDKDLHATISGLRGDCTYSFRLKAAEGNEPRLISDYSYPLFIPIVPPSPPGRPSTNVKDNAGLYLAGQSVTSNTAVVEWDPSQHDGGERLLGYKVLVHKLNADAFRGQEEVSEPLVAPWVQSTTTKGLSAQFTRFEDGKPVSYKCSNLAPGAYYCFEVKAINSQGPSLPSPCSSILKIPGITPAECRGLVARSLCEDQMVLAWQPPVASEGQCVTEYHVVAQPKFCKDGESIDDPARQEVLSADNLSPFWIRYIFKDLKPSIEYTFSVAAKNMVGIGAFTQCVRVG